MSTALGKVCNACGVERKKTKVLYDPDQFMPYCEHPYICNDEHPNSPKNMIARGEELKLLELADATEKFHQWLALNHPDKEKAARIRRMVTQPITIRIGSPEMAQFVLDLQDEFSFSSVSDTIRYCIQAMKESRHGFYSEHKKLADVKQEVARVEEVKKEVEKAVSAPAPEPQPQPDEEKLVF
jgi:Arc/MetJ-type ribon-helix-helix transcriptional regulator